MQAILQKYEYFLQDSSKILASFESNLQDSCEVLNRDCKIFFKTWKPLFLLTGYRARLVELKMNSKKIKVKLCRKIISSQLNKTVRDFFKYDFYPPPFSFHIFNTWWCFLYLYTIQQNMPNNRIQFNIIVHVSFDFDVYQRPDASAYLIPHT